MKDSTQEAERHHRPRNRLAQHVMLTCVGDLSRQLAEGRMPKTDVPAAVNFIAEFSYEMADAMLWCAKAPPKEWPKK